MWTGAFVVYLLTVVGTFGWSLARGEPNYTWLGFLPLPRRHLYGAGILTKGAWATTKTGPVRIVFQRDGGSLRVYEGVYRRIGRVVLVRAPVPTRRVKRAKRLRPAFGLR